MFKTVKFNVQVVWLPLLHVQIFMMSYFFLWTCLADSRTETKSTAKHDIHTDDFEAGKKNSDIKQKHMQIYATAAQILAKVRTATK